MKAKSGLITELNVFASAAIGWDCINAVRTVFTYQRPRTTLYCKFLQNFYRNKKEPKKPSEQGISQHFVVAFINKFHICPFKGEFHGSAHAQALA